MKMKNAPLQPDEIVNYLATKGIQLGEDELEDLLGRLNLTINDVIKRQRKRRRITQNDSAKESWPASAILKLDQIERLPTWVSDVLDESRIVGSSKQVLQTPDGKKYHLGNPLNELSGGEWTFFLNSVLSTRYPTSGPESFAHHIRKIHPSPKPPQLMKSIIEFFTKKNEHVLDYFMGVGGTLLGASLSGRQAVGIDLSERYVDAYKQASQELGLPEQSTIIGNSLDILNDPREHSSLLSEDKFSLIAIDPPYGDMMNREKTGEAIKKNLDSSPTPFTDLDSDLGNLSLESFFPTFKQSVESSMRYLRNGGHIVVFIKDLQPNATSTNLIHARIIEDLANIQGFQYLGMKIWADLGVNLYPYGYPYSFVSNQIHQYIMFFKKVR
jgi:DNA modification methylase